MSKSDITSTKTPSKEVSDDPDAPDVGVTKKVSNASRKLLTGLLSGGIEGFPEPKFAKEYKEIDPDIAEPSKEDPTLLMVKAVKSAVTATEKVDLGLIATTLIPPLPDDLFPSDVFISKVAGVKEITKTDIVLFEYDGFNPMRTQSVFEKIATASESNPVTDLTLLFSYMFTRGTRIQTKGISKTKNVAHKKIIMSLLLKYRIQDNLKDYKDSSVLTLSRLSWAYPHIAFKVRTELPDTLVTLPLNGLPQGLRFPAAIQIIGKKNYSHFLLWTCWALEFTMTINRNKTPDTVANRQAAWKNIVNRSLSHYGTHASKILAMTDLNEEQKKDLHLAE